MARFRIAWLAQGGELSRGDVVPEPPLRSEDGRQVTDPAQSSNGNPT
jgi:hypothetical protein